MPTSPVAVVEILEGDVSCRAAAVRPKAAAQVIQFEGLLVTQYSPSMPARQRRPLKPIIRQSAFTLEFSNAPYSI
jgi:hypothetical protein